MSPALGVSFPWARVTARRAQQLLVGALWGSALERKGKKLLPSCQSFSNMPQLHALCRVETTGLKINIYLIFSLFCKYPAVWLDKSLSQQFTFLRGSVLRPKISPEKTCWEAAATRTRPSCPSLVAASARGLPRGGERQEGTCWATARGGLCAKFKD